MSTIGIVALSLLVGAFIIAMLGLSAWLVYLLIMFRRDVSAVRVAFRSFVDDTSNLLTLHRSEIRGAFESQSESWARAISSLSDTLTHHHQEWSLTTDKFSSILNTHRSSTDEQIRRINGQELSEAVSKFATLCQQEAAAATRIERAAIAIGTFSRIWLNDQALNERIEPLTEGVDNATGYAAAEPGERFVLRSRTATDDASVLEEESADVTTPEQP